MSGPKRILLCDDDPGRAPQWKKCAEDALRGGAKVSVLTGAGLENALSSLASLARGTIAGSLDVKRALIPFEEHDIVFLDNNLLHIFTNQPVMTAETFVGQLLAFSDCPFVGVLNRQPEAIFDLQLKGDTASKSDLSVASTQLSETGLWSRSWKDFRPWYWPFVLEAPDKRRKQWRWLRTRLDRPLLASLGFTGKMRSLPPESLQIFGSSDPLSMTFRDFFLHQSRILAPDLRKELRANDEVVCRVVGSEISHWILHDVLMRQETLVDDAHLALRVPSIVKKLHTIVKESPAVQHEKVAKMIDGIRLTKKAAFASDIWLPHRSWWFNEIDRDGTITGPLLGVLSGLKQQERVAFCEDSSKYVRIVDGRRYRYSSHSLAGTRFISNKRPRGYIPRTDLMT